MNNQEGTPKVEFDEFGFVKEYACPSCGGKLKLDHTDDVGTNWFRCEKCGQQTWKPKSPERRQLEADLKKAGTVLPEPPKKLTQADKLIKLCVNHTPVLFHDQHKTPYARVKKSDVNVTLLIRSKTFKTWLARLLWLYEEKAPGSEALHSAINILEAIALFEGQEHTLYNRVAPAEDGFWIDMTDEKCRAIKVTAEGWKIVDDPPILFKRYSHQKPLPEPKPGGNCWRFFDFINIDEKDEKTRLCLLCAIMTFLIPTIPHVILVLYGIQGSGKTMFFKLLRALIDPSAVDVLTIPRNEKERVQQLDHHWCAFFDNIGSLKPWASDTFCRAATGGGFTKRELYTDDSDVIYNFKRCVGLNAINIAAQRGDLLDRSLLVGLHAIPKEKRKTEKQLLTEFDSCKAEILGGFLDTLVKAIRLYPSINPKGLFRMADFTRWGCAIAVALGYKQEDFIEAYQSKIVTQVEEAANASPVATVLVDLMESLKKWDGPPSQLYIALVNHAKQLNISTHQKAWPKAPHVLIRQLNELAPSLQSLGCKVTTGIKSGSTRKILIESVPSVPNAKNQEGKRDGRDAISTSSSKSLSVGEKLKIVYDEARALSKDGLVSKFDVADALKGRVDRNDVFKLLEKLDEEGKLAAKGQEYYLVV